MTPMEKMKAWVYHTDPQPEGSIHIRLEEVPIPKAEAGDILLRVHRASVCGTDETLFSGKLKRASEGVIPGHEICGEVIELGPGVTDLRLGDMVAVESHYSLPGGVDEGVIGLWPPVTPTGQPLRVYDGGYAEFVAIPALCAHRLPPELAHGPFWPSLFEPAGNDFLLAKEVIESGSPRKVGVVGCGPHGLYALIFLKHFGVSEIVAFEPDPYRREFARSMGCALDVLDPNQPDVSARVAELTGGEGFDACVDMVGKSGEAFQFCCELTREKGMVVLFGVFSRDCTIEGKSGNDLIFGRQRMTIFHHGKKLSLLGVTGREGIWEDLIRAVAGNADLQEQLMLPVTIVGPLNLLGEHIERRRPDVLKAAFLPFV